MFHRLSAKIGVWAVAAILAALMIDIGLNHLGWENTPAAALEGLVTIGLMFYLYFFARKLVFRPMEEIEKTAERIKAGDLGARTNISSSRELSVLSETLNSMLEKLAESNRQLQEYNMTLVKTVEERTRELNSERELRIALLTHDLKSPLTSIMGYSELLLSGGRLEKNEAECVQGIMHSGERLLDMAELYLEMTKLEAGISEVKLKAVDPGAVVKEAVAGLKVQALEKKISLSYEAADMPSLLADEEKMVRIFTNLIVNAIKYTPEGGSVKIDSYAESADNGGPLWAVSVSDTGYGIPPEDLDNVFKTYYRSSSSAGTRGSGLGLAAVKSFVEAHAGSIHVESLPGKGSKFTVRIPARQEMPENTERETIA